MAAEQIALPFRLIKGEPSIKERGKQTNTDLIGRSFFDGSVAVTVVSLCRVNPKQVIVKRGMDGRSWSVPAGVIRLIVGRKRRRRAA